MNNHENNRGNLLLELFSEEIPARMQADSEKQLENLFTSSVNNSLFLPMISKVSINYLSPLSWKQLIILLIYQ